MAGKSDIDNDVLVGGASEGFSEETNDLVEEEMLLELQQMHEHQASDKSDVSFTDALDSSASPSEEVFEFTDEYEIETEQQFLDDHAGALSSKTVTSTAQSNQEATTAKTDTPSNQEPEIAGEGGNGNNDGTEIDSSGGGGNGGSDDEEPEPDKPLWLKPWFLAVAFLSLALFVGGGYWLSVTVLNGAKRVVTQPQPQQNQQMVTQVDSGLIDGTATSINDESVYNGIVGVSEPQAITDIVNRDPEVGQYINGLKLDLKRLQSELDIANESKSRLADKAAASTQKVDVLNDELTRSKNQKSDLEKSLDASEQAFKKFKADAESNINALKSENDKLQIRNKTLGAEIDNIRQSSLVREQKDKEALADLSTQLSQVLAELGKLNKSNQSNKPRARTPLAELRYLGMDYEKLAGIFEVIRNGRKDSKPIYLTKGESLLGRGVIQNVDDYGCITFTNGRQYEPLNGACK